MTIDPLDRNAEHLMHRWVLPAFFGGASVFCVGIAGSAVLDEHWTAAAVLAAVAIGLARFADQARRAG